MLYPTHIRFGWQFGIAISLALIANYHSLFIIKTPIDLIIAIVLMISGAIYGSGFPDIDSKQSIPAYEHPVMRKVFELFQIHHRGPISHSVLSETIIWGIPIMIFYLLSRSNPVTFLGLNENQVKMLFIIFLGFASTDEIRSVILIGKSFIQSDHRTWNGIKNTVLFLMTDDYAFAKESHFHRPNREDKKKYRPIALAIGTLFFLFFFGISGNDDLKQYFGFYAIYLTGILAGVYSHLLADMSTKQGIYLDWKHQIQIGKWMQRTPILKWFVPNNEFRTGSTYETVVRIIVSSVNMLLLLILFMHLFITIL